MKYALRDKAAELRRRHILEAATTVFALRGYHRTTIRDIAATAGVADGTIYRVFENKAAILVGLLDPLDDRSAPLPSPDLEIDPEVFIRSMLGDAWRRFTPPVLDALRIVMSEALVDASLRAMYIERIIAPAIVLPTPVIERLVATKRLAPVQPALVVRALISAVMGFVVLRLLGEPWVVERWESIPEHVSDLLMRGLLPIEADEKR